MDNQEVAKFFATTKAAIMANEQLRDPQREGFNAVAEHFAKSNAPCYVQLPVGCGKTGLMAIMPFGLSDGRVLVIAPNIVIRDTILKALDLSKPAHCFYTQRGVLKPPLKGPFVAELTASANIHDCAGAHIVVSTAHQFMLKSGKWYEKFPREYFRMILVDEGHHSAAPTWQTLFDYFNKAKIVSFTATPFRADGKAVTGKRVYKFDYTRAMLFGYISQVDAVHAMPESITFTVKGKERTLSLEQIMKMKEKDWFSKGVALSEECDRHIVDASLKYLDAVREHGQPRMIIGAACSIRHAAQIKALYEERGMKAEVLSSDMKKEERDRVEAALRAGLIDAVVQVQILGEGYDLSTLSVAAVFRPFRSLAPYIQFVGRILRLAQPQVPHSAANKVYVVSHVGLNDERWWEDFKNFDKADQAFFSSYLGDGAEEIVTEGDEKKKRLTLRPFMRVLNETIEKYVQKGFLKKIDEKLVNGFFEQMKTFGFDPLEFGLTPEIIKQRLAAAAQAPQPVAAHEAFVQPQRRRDALLKRLAQEARSIADTVLNRLNLPFGGLKIGAAISTHAGKDNGVALIALAFSHQNRVMGVEGGGRDEATLEQIERAVQASADIVDRLHKFVSEKLAAKAKEQ